MAFKIQGSYDTEIYTTQGGYVAIKQVDLVDREDRVVLLAPHQLPDVISELQMLWEEREAWEVSSKDDEDEETVVESDAKPPAAG